MKAPFEKFETQNAKEFYPRYGKPCWRIKVFVEAGPDHNPELSRAFIEDAIKDKKAVGRDRD